MMNSFNNGRMKKSQQLQETANIYYGSRPKNRPALNDSINRRYEQDNNKNITKKSIDVSLTQQIRQHITLQQNNQLNTKQHYKRNPHNFRKLTGPQRYDQEEKQREPTRMSSKSPYLRVSQPKPQRESLNKQQLLNKSTHKIRSGQLIKQASPRVFYRQPRSSLSQHYDPTIENNLHKRRTSLIGEEKGGLLEEAKECYKAGNYPKSMQMLKRFIKLNRSSVEGRYLLGMSMINNSELNLGVEELLQVINVQPTYKRSLYLVVALAYKRLMKYDDAIEILTKGIELYPDYYDCLVYRGKLYLKKQDYEQALTDFTSAININKSKGFAYVGKGTCEKQLGNYQQAIQTFTQGFNTQMSHICMEKRGITYYQLDKLDLALKDFDRCSGSGSSATHYYRGMISYRSDNIVQSLLCFQQALKHDNSRQCVTLSVQMMMRIKIEEKDFYEAYHILTRADNVEVDAEALNEWRLFIEGSLFLMKKKYKEGIATLQSLLTLHTFSTSYSHLNSKHKKQRHKFIKPLVHLYKAFGQLCENKPENAEKQYSSYEKLCDEFKTDRGNLSKDYNKQIMKCYKTFPNESRKLIEQAIRLIPSKPEPYLYLAFDIINNKFEMEKDPSIKNDYITEAIESISIGIQHLPQLSNNHISTFYYYRSILYLYKSDFNKCVADVDKAIEKSQDNIPKYFYLRGLIFAVFGNFTQAVQDLTVAINLDEKYPKPYLERAKCLQIQGNSNEAFLDLQRYITLAPEDQQIHKYAGYLLFQNCAYQDCLSAFSHGTDSQGDFQLILTKAKCHFLLGQDEKAIKLFKIYCENTYSLDYESDITIMEVCGKIRQATKQSVYLEQIKLLDNLIASKTQQSCKIFKMRDMHQLKASICLLLGNYQSSVASFCRTLELFNSQKSKQLQKHFIQDSEQFQDEWSQVEIKFNLSICYLALGKYQQAKDMLLEFEKSSEKGRNWKNYMQLIDDLIQGKKIASIKLDTFEQNHRISKNWPKIALPNTQVSLSMAFSYPFVEPPELLPQFDQEFFLEFNVTKSQQKPEAPWINRGKAGLVFTPNVQVYQNLELSMTTTKNNESERNKPNSEMEKSGNLSHSDFQLQTEDLKKKFKLDSLVQMKLQKLMKKP